MPLATNNNTNVATMFNPANVTFQALQVKEAKAASQTLGLQLRYLEVRPPTEFEAVFRTVVQKQIPERSAKRKAG